MDARARVSQSVTEAPRRDSFRPGCRQTNTTNQAPTPRPPPSTPKPPPPPLLLVPQARRLGLWGFPPGPLILSQPRSHRGQRIPSQEARSGNVGATRKATLSLPCPAPPSPSPSPSPQRPAGSGIPEPSPELTPPPQNAGVWRADKQIRKPRIQQRRPPAHPGCQANESIPHPTPALRVACTDCCRTCVFISGLAAEGGGGAAAVDIMASSTHAKLPSLRQRWSWRERGPALGDHDPWTARSAWRLCACV